MPVVLGQDFIVVLYEAEAPGATLRRGRTWKARDLNGADTGLSRFS
jgi:hypothetical protein